jgi:hypothetical protein
MYTFPDVSHLPQGLDGTQIYGGSIGSNRIFDYLKNSAPQLTAPRWDLYLINVFTLVRNAHVKGMNQKQLEEAVDHDSDMFMTYIGAYTGFRKQTPAVVYFYAPDYSAVPKELMRVHTGNQEELDRMYHELYKKLPDKVTELTEIPSTQKFLSRVGRSIFPHKDLNERIRYIYQGRRNHGLLGTVMISHCVLDFHLYKAISGLQVLESYTGAILTSQDFGQKLVKEVKVPFNATTHRLFGDSIQLNPLIKGRDRTKLVELAKDKHWFVKTEAEISRDVLFEFSSLSQNDLSVLRL